MVFCNEQYGFYESIQTNGHNPYFNRWFSAIQYGYIKKNPYKSQSLF